jgi:pyrroline-5-carboxylate reductase
MAEPARIGCIGTGNMGGAIISGISEFFPPGNIFVYDKDESKARHISSLYRISRAETIEDVAKICDIIITAVKPGDIPAVLEKLKPHCEGKTIVSIAAGISIKELEKILGSSQKIVRVMPNTPSLVHEGMSVLTANKAIDSETLEQVREIFEKIGTAIVMPEKYMDAVTGVSGSGPAYVFTFIQAMADGAVKMGLPRKEALILAAQTVLGAAKMVLQEDTNPIELRDGVTSPGGTTIEAVHILEDRGFAGAVMSAIEAATKKSRNMGNE